MAARFKIYELARIPGRTIFIDTNVLLYLFWPTGNLRCESDYAKFLSACMVREVPLAIDFLVVSEATNRMLRMEHEKTCNSRGIDKHQWRFKDFRDSPEGQQAQSDIFEVLTKCLGRLTVVGKAFSASDIAGFLSVDRLDIIDKAIACLCCENDFVLATHDADFAGASIDIISANPAFN